MNSKLAEKLHNTALELALKMGYSLAMVDIIHQYLVYLGWEFSLTTVFQIQRKAEDLMCMEDWGLSRAQWAQMNSVCSSFDF
jgi:hypothetical protein